MRLLFILPFIFSCSVNKKSECNYITDYYQTIYIADYEFETKNYPKAFDLYQIAFNSCEPITTIGYNEIENFAETTAILKKYEMTYELLKKSILGGSELIRFKNNSNFEGFFSSHYGAQLMNEYDSLNKQFMDNVDLKLREEIMFMCFADQGVRNQVPEIDWEKVDSVDKLHEKRLIELFENKGFPNVEMIGSIMLDHAQVDVGILLLHTDDSIRLNYFVPKVKEFVRKGKASPYYVGAMMDQYYFYHKKPQIYGTIRGVEMIDDLKKVNNNRISIGLAPLELQRKKDSLIKIRYGL
ncbi:hypothetical protein F3C99_00115 [Vitellibacter sp. q18]|jgi:hypothetical protein|nr:hypothetical protein [Aequorivita lutea]